MCGRAGKAYALPAARPTIVQLEDEWEMRTILILTLIAIGATMLAPTVGFAQSFERWDRPTTAPVGALQPRGSNFSPNSPANRAEQRRLSKFDAKQKKRNRKLDRDLNICRC